MANTFRLLIVEDMGEWRDRIERACKQQLTDVFVATARDVTSALDALRQNHFHYVSVDQNIPITAGEIVSAQNGVDLCERLVSERPLTDRSIYTSHGYTNHANRAGRLDDTLYFEKRATVEPLRTDVEELDVGDYVRRVSDRLLEGYCFWALERVRRIMPAALGEPAHELSQAWKVKNWRVAVDGLTVLWERTVELAWAQCASVAVTLDVDRAAFGRTTKFTPAEKEEMLLGLWSAIAKRGGMKWQKYIGNGDKATGRGVGKAFVDASQRLRILRNKWAHSELSYATESDVSGRKSDIVRLLDAIAFWGEVPLVTNPHYHPSEKGKIRYTRLAGNPPWPEDDILIEISQVKQAAEHVYCWWGESGETRIMDLFPFIIMMEGEAGRLEPHVFVNLTSGRPRYRSLINGSIADRVAPSEATRVLTAIFGAPPNRSR